MKTLICKRGLSYALSAMLVVGLFFGFGWSKPPEAYADNEATIINLASVSASGTGYTYANNVITVSDGANVILTGATTTNRIVAASGATATVTLSDAGIDVGGTADACAFDMTGATVNLILSGVNSLKSNGRSAGLQVPANSNVTITSVSGDDSTDGTLAASGGQNQSGARGAGIGAPRATGAGTIIINGGTITANAGYDANGSGAGIGGGGAAQDTEELGGVGGNITINGGKVTATGSPDTNSIQANGGAGIGGGGGRNQTDNTGGPGGNVTINGGDVTANSRERAAAIGSGSHSGTRVTTETQVVSITGGTVTATANSNGAGVGGGYNSPGGTISISGGTVKSTANYGAGIGGGYNSAGEDITISGGTVTATATGNGAGIGGGYGGAGGDITISGGTVTATGIVAAGIGGGYNSAGGNITISGSTVTATGGTGGAGIGGGQNGAGGTITISSSTVTARSGNSGAGIGGGNSGAGGNITINSGTVMATGGAGGAGIGGGNGAGGSAGTIQILGGTVVAITPTNTAASIGGGTSGSGDGSIAISGSGTVITNTTNSKGIGITSAASTETTISGTPVVLALAISTVTGSSTAETATVISATTNITVVSSVATTGTITLVAAQTTIKENTTLTIPKGWTLTKANKTFTNNGTIINNGTLTGTGATTNAGTIINSGTINNTGTITNNGTIKDSGTITGTEIAGTGVRAFKGLTVSLAAGPGSLTLAPQTADDGYAFYYTKSDSSKTTVDYLGGLDTISTDSPMNATAFAASTDITDLTNGSTYYVQVYKVSTDDGKIVGYGEASGIPVAPISTAAIAGITAPVTGAAPSPTITPSAEYTKTVVWDPAVNGTFLGGFTYTAKITLTPKAGYTLTGVSEDFFTVADANATNAADSGVITAEFPATNKASAGTVIDTSDNFTSATGTGWSYTDDVFTIENGANVTITGKTTTKKIVVPSGANATVTLSGANIDLSGTTDACAFDMTGATVNLILSGENILKSNGRSAGLQVPEGSKVTITSASGDGDTFGKLSVNDATSRTGARGAGIGAPRATDAGEIIINGGTIVANAGYDAIGSGAGIGGGGAAQDTEELGGAGGKITINGGKVNATGTATSNPVDRFGGAGIGGGGATRVSPGNTGGPGGIITINGGEVTANGSNGGAGIGSGSCAEARVTEKTQVILIEDGTVSANTTNLGAGIGGGSNGTCGSVTINGGTVNATASSHGAGIGGGSNGAGGNIKIVSGTVTATSSNTSAAIGGGHNAGGGTIDISGGLIYAANTYAYADGGAAIGGGSLSSGSDTRDGSAGNITISDGVVVANSVSAGAIIGGGAGNSDGTIEISGGTVIAGGANGVGISAVGGFTETSISEDAVVLAKDINPGATIASTATAISGSKNITITASGSPTATAGTITLVKAQTVTANTTITLPVNWTLDTHGKKLTNNGSIGGTAKEFKGLTVSLTAGTNKLTLAAPEAESGFAYYYTTSDTPKTTGGYLNSLDNISAETGKTEYSTATEINLADGSRHYVQIYKVVSVGADNGKIVGYGEGSGMSGTPIGTAAIAGVTVPVAGAMNTTEITETGEYTADISWNPAIINNKFSYSTQYTATITLTPKTGSTLTDVAENFFTVSGATATNDADSGVITAIFPTTEASANMGTSIDVTDANLVGGETGDSWSYNGQTKVFTITDGANITVTGTTTTNKIVVTSGATANIALSGASISPASGNAFDMTGATVNLKLSGTNTLKSGSGAAGLQAPAGSTLIIDSADSTEQNPNRTSGTLTATGGTYGAGIGGGQSGAGGSITINGGTVTATNTNYGAGIGGGYNSAGGTTTINGGAVTATGGGAGAGIGGGYNGAGGSTTINGGTVIANSGGAAAGIGGGAGKAGGTININGGTVTASGTAVYENNYGAGIGGGYNGGAGTINITGGTVTATGGPGAAGIGGGNGVTIGDVNVSEVISISNAKVTATGGQYGAGIGGGNLGSGGTITINSGTVMAKGGSNYGAGIGGGSDGSAGKIKILGGTVIGIGGSANAAGVGGGDGGSGDGSIAISGGTVIANQKGIGITNIGSAVTTISGNAVVLATGISAATGSGIANTATAIYGTTNITLSASIATAGTITLAANQAIKENTELTVPKGWTLTTNGKTLTNEGAITNEGTVTNANANGTIVNKGAITNEGTITNTNASSAIINEGTVTNNGTITNTNGVIVNYGTADGSGAWPAFYDVNVTFDNKIDAEGYISSATYNNVPIRNGAKVAGTNKALVITAADRRESADTTYAWSGDGTNNVTTPTLTISNLAAALDATCEISGTDTITPTLTPGEVIRTSDTDASVSFTASEAGEYYYEAVDDNTDEPTIDTSEAGAAFTWEDLTITIHPDSITAGAKDVYIKAKDKAIAGNNVSDALKITIPAYAPPELTKGEVIRASETEATVEFTSDKDGKYYYSVVEHGEEAPDIDVSGNGTDITENAEASISLDELTSGAKDVYIKVKTTVDSVSMVSPALKISIIEVLQPELTGGNQKLTLAPQTAEAGYAFYYAHDTQSAAQPQFGDAISSITEATAYTAEAVITNLTNDAAHYVQIYKVETTGNTIVGYGEASETPEAGESPEPEKPTVTVTATPETEAEYGENVTFTATVSNGTGTVQFKDGALDLGSAVNISEGTAEYETSELGVGEHSITAVYSGDNNYSEATSSALTYNIIGAAPEITGAATKSVTYGYEAASSGMLTITGNPAPTVTKQSGDAKITWNATTKKLDIKSGLAAGIYPVEIKASNGVNPDDIFTFTLTVDKAAASIIAHPAAKTDLAYTGNPQNLLSVSGSTADGALKFAVTAKGAAAPNDSAYTDAAEATNAGDYTVWYKIFGDENHDDSAPLYINVTITKNEDIKVSSVNITGAPEKFAYKASGKNNTLSLSVNVSAATNMGVTWSSSSPAIATVDQNGLVTFKGAEGPVIITAGANDGSNISHSVTITAYKNVGAPVTTLKTIYLTKGKSYTPPIVMYDGGAEVKAKIAWKTSDAKTAKVNKSTGKITVPKKPKKTKATITGTTLGGKKIVIKVNIAKKSLKLKKATIKAPKKLKPKKTGKITVKLVQSKATNISIIFKSSKASGLYVNKVGKITAKKKGNYTVTVSAGGKKYKVKIAVK